MSRIWLPRCNRIRPGRLRAEPLEQRWLLSVAPTWEHVFRADGFLSAPAEGDALALAEAYLAANAEPLGLEPSDLAAYVVTDRYRDDHNGVTHIYLRQTLNDLEISGAEINVNVSRDGEMINVGSRFLANLAEAGNISTTPELSATEAAQAAARAWGIKTSAEMALLADYSGLERATMLAAPGLSLDEVPARLHYVYDGESGLQLAWNLVVRTTDGEHWYEASVDASDGRLLRAADWIDDAVYNVIPSPVEAPNDGSRALVTDPHEAVKGAQKLSGTQVIDALEGVAEVGGEPLIEGLVLVLRRIESRQPRKACRPTFGLKVTDETPERRAVVSQGIGASAALGPEMRQIGGDGVGERARTLGAGGHALRSKLHRICRRHQAVKRGARSALAALERKQRPRRIPAHRAADR